MAEQARKNVKPFGFADKVGYFFGDFGNDFTFMLSSMFMMKFYTDVMGGFSRNRGTSDDGGAFCRCSDRCDNGTDCRPICTDEGWKVQTRAVTRTMTEMFALGMFENPYRDPKQAEKVIYNQADWDHAMEAHRKSVVLLKNDGILPLTTEKCAGKKVYVECFHKDPKMAEKATESLKKQVAEDAMGVTLTNSVEEADLAILLLQPSSGAYFSATPGYLELGLCEDKEVCNVDEERRPTAETHLETILSGVKRIAQIAEILHSHGGKVIANVNITLAWEVGNVEPHCDAFLAGFDTYVSATLDVIFGRFAPTGKLPVTLPRGDEVLAVNADGVCISPNDVPGYDKDQYLPDELKDENGKAYAYRDQAGNYYELDFGLNYESSMED